MVGLPADEEDDRSLRRHGYRRRGAGKRGDGECSYYDVADVPSWVDHVYPAELITQQYDYHGTYIHGFINSLFG